jgi:predicted nucleic acid-binding Zn ribbon protein
MSPQASAKKCHRCLQPVPPRAQRCPHCGDMLKRELPRVSIFLGVLGVIVLLGIGLVLYFMPPEQSDAGGKPQQQSTPAPKKPPLN